MKEFKVVSKTFVKSKNSISKILSNYTKSLLIFIILITIYNLINKEISLVINLYKSLLITLISSIIFEYIINLFTKEKSIKLIFTKDNILPIALSLGLFSTNCSYIIIIASVSITLIIRKIFKNVNLYSILFGILFIELYKYFQNELITPLTNLHEIGFTGTYETILKSNGNIMSYLIGTNYLSPILSILIFIYLFIKKSIKYNIVITYNITFIIMMLIIGLFNDMNIWYSFFQITTGNLLFLSIYCLTDYGTTPQTSEGQVIYGIIIATITTILRFIIPELSVIIALILGPIILTKLIENISSKLKYNQKFNIASILCTILISLITTTIITILI